MRRIPPSQTAFLIAKSTFLMAHNRECRSLISPEAAQWARWFIEDHLPLGRWWTFGIQCPPIPQIYRLLERRILPGIQLHYAVRKKWLEQEVRAALAEGVEQVLVFGGGMDSLTLRLAREFPRVPFVEVDRTATQHLKVESVHRRNPMLPNLHFYAADLLKGDRMDQIRALPALRSGVPGIAIAEGLLMYLPEAHVRDLFTSVARFFGDGSRFLFTAMVPDTNGHLRFHQAAPYVHRWLARKQEPFTWGLPAGDLSGFVTSCGFKRVALVDDQDLRAQFLKPLQLSHKELAIGEILGEAVV